MSKINIQPLADRIVIVPVSEKKTLSGIIIPETGNKERPEKGEVVAVGPGRITDDGKNIPPQIKVGDIVVFAKYGPEEVKVDGVDYYILREDQVLAVIK
jgi:chaperonin GroES